MCPGLSWSPVGCTAHRDEGRVDIPLHGGPEQNREIEKGKGREEAFFDINRKTTTKNMKINVIYVLTFKLVAFEFKQII